ncbi:MAG TPA: FG-GAP-like repeat-containing protein [Candidatus Sulfotelmatobacter sp.]|jgi:hypothetical protein
MKFSSFVCLLLLPTALFAQSKAIPSASPPQGAPIFSGASRMLLSSSNGISRVSSTPALRPQMSGLGFANAAVYGSNGENAYALAIADVNGDGKPDLVVANGFGGDNGDGLVAVFLNNGDGTFAAAVTFDSGGFQPLSVAVADINGDGKPDIIVANCGIGTGGCIGLEGGVSVLIGNGDGTFQTAAAYSSGGQMAESVAVADVNGDGKPDIIVANQCQSSTSCNGTVGVLISNGDGTFQSAVTYGSGGNDAESVAVADVNGDGKPDLLVANYCQLNACTGTGLVGVLLGNGDGTFQTAATYNAAVQSVAVADVNGDGNADLLVAGASSVGVLLGNGNGTFQPVVSYGSGGFDAWSVAAADVNGDGKPDLVVANYCADSSCNVENNSDSVVGVLLGNGDGTFQTVVTFSSGGYYDFSIAAVDVNGDSKPDIVVANICYSSSSCANGSAAVLINASLGTTTAEVWSSPNPSNNGQTVIFTASISSLGFKITPTGTVTLFDGTTSLGSSSLNSSGVATLSTAALTIGTHSITASYSGDSNFSSSTSSVLSQVVQGAIAQLSTTTLTFGNETVGMTSLPAGFTLTNAGNTNLVITSIGITGANSADFAESGTCGNTLVPGQICSYSVTFTPTATGTRTATLTFTDNASNSPQSIALSGIGVLPAVTLSPTSLTFATQVVFTSSKAQTVTLNNTGLGILNISKIAITGPFTETNNCGSTVNSGSGCTLNVTFKPKTSGVLTGSLSITDNASLSPQKVPLKGTGTDVQLTPASLNFGNQPVGTRSLPKKITLSNKASVAISVTSISIIGADAGDFAETNTCGKSVAGGASCAITVTFTPSAKGSRSASVSIVDNGGGSPQKVSLAGTGT